MPYWGFTRYRVGQWGASLSQPPLELNVTVGLNFGKWQWAELRKEQNHCQSTSLKEEAACFPLPVSLSFWLQHDVMLLGLLQPCGPEQCLRDVGTDLGPWATTGTELPKPPGSPVYRTSIYEKQKRRSHDGTTAFGGFVVIVV